MLHANLIYYQTSRKYSRRFTAVILSIAWILHIHTDIHTSDPSIFLRYPANVGLTVFNDISKPMKNGKSLNSLKIHAI